MPPSELTRAGIAPTPPSGPTTQTGLAAMAVGVILAVLLLFDVVPTPEKVQAIGVVVSGLFVVVPYITMAISRTKQANNLAKLAQGERLANPARLLDAGEVRHSHVPSPEEIASWPSTPATPTEATPQAAGLAPLAIEGPDGDSALVWAEPHIAAKVQAHEHAIADGTLGAPVDLALEVGGGGAKPGRDVPLEAPAEGEVSA
jgi:hypothetical protein